MKEPPDREILLVGGRIYPHCRARPSESILIRDGRVAAVGEAAVLRRVKSSRAEVVDLAGATVTAGFIDSHVHLTTWALSRASVDLSDAASVEEAAARVADAAREGSGWVRGHGWRSDRWSRMPTRHDLDQIAPERPIFLDSHDLHSAWLNTRALALCGVDEHTADPPSGRIEREPGTGLPTGILRESARANAARNLPDASPDDIRAALLRAQGELHRLGIVGVHSVEEEGLRDFGLLVDRGELRLRVLHYIPADRLETAVAEGLRGGQGNDWLRIGGVKIFLDGSLGSRTAWMREPYAGEDRYRGIQSLPIEDFRRIVSRAAASGLSSAVHAIGDAAVEAALEVLAAVPFAAGIPHRVEHLQLCPPDLWERAGASGITGSVQPTHLLSDREIAERYWSPDRCRGAYPFGALVRAGMVLAFGSDAPVETPDPRPALYAATARGTWEHYYAGQAADIPDPGWFPEHRLSPREAVAAFTEGPALASGLARSRGRLRPGFDADLVAWTIDPLAADPREYREMRCVLTIVGGEIVHRSDG